MRIGLIGISVRAAAEAVSACILDTVAIDYFADHDTQLALPNRCFQISDWSQVDAIIQGIDGRSETGIQEDSRGPNSDRRLAGTGERGWIATGGLELSPKILRSLAACGQKVLGCQEESLQFGKTPERWCSVLQDSGVSVPKYSRSSACPPGHWFLKEAWGEDRWFWQAVVPGELASAIYLATPQTTELVGCTRLFCRSDYRYLGNLATTQWPESALIDPLQRIGKTLAQAGQFQGLFGVDFVLDCKRRVWPLEINPRPSASVEVLAEILQRNLFLEHLRACGWPLSNGDSDNAKSKGESPQIACKFTLYTQGPPLTITDRLFNWLVDRREFRSTDLEQNRWLGAMDGDFASPQRYWQQRFADIPRLGTTIPTGQPICTLLANGTLLAPATGFDGESSVEPKRLLQWLCDLEGQVFGCGTAGYAKMDANLPIPACIWGESP